MGREGRGEGGREGRGEGEGRREGGRGGGKGGGEREGGKGGGREGRGEGGGEEGRGGEGMSFLKYTSMCWLCALRHVALPGRNAQNIIMGIENYTKQLHLARDVGCLQRAIADHWPDTFTLFNHNHKIHNVAQCRQAACLLSIY